MILNGYFWLILCALTGFHVLDSVANWLNLKSLKPALPSDFKGVYDEAEYQRLTDYTAVTARFEFLESTFMLAVQLIFWFCGGYQWLDEAVRMVHQQIVFSGLLFIGSLWIGATILALPWDLYETFVIEEKFGFNKTTLSTFICDKLKTLVVGCLLGGSLLSVVLMVFQQGGPLAWLYAWLCASVFLVGFAYLAPAIILPMFNKFVPLEDGELKSAIMGYAAAVRFPIGGIFVMDGSKRSTKANAFFTGFGKNRRIALFDTLIANHTIKELVAVIAHEVGHFKHRHVVQHLGVAIANIGIFLYCASRFINAHGLFEAFGVKTLSVYCGLALFLVFYNPLIRCLSIAQSIQTRRHEYAADRFAVETTRDPQGMIDALKKLSKANLTNLAPHPLYVILYHSHPPILKRIEAIRKAAAGQ